MIDDFGAGVVAFTSSAGGVDADDVVFARYRRQPDAQAPVVLGIEWVTAIFESTLDHIEIEYAFARREEARLGIFGVLLNGEAAETGGEAAPEQDLRGS